MTYGVVETPASALSLCKFFAEIAVWEASCCKPTRDSRYVVSIVDDFLSQCVVM